METNNLDEFLANPGNYTTVSLNGKNITDADCEKIAAALGNANQLTTLHLHNNQIGDTGMTSIAGVLEGNTNLLSLQLGSNNFGYAGAVAIGKILAAPNMQLAELDLSSNQIGDDGASAIAEGLKTNKTLTYLDFTNNQIGDAGASAIAKELPNTNLNQLFLGNNQIGDGGAIAIGELLANNPVLKWIDLNNNQIGSTGASAIAEGLKTNQSLVGLQLKCNNISDQVVDQIKQTGTRLWEKFDLSNQKIDEGKEGDRGEHYPSLEPMEGFGRAPSSSQEGYGEGHGSRLESKEGRGSSLESKRDLDESLDHVPPYEPEIEPESIMLFPNAIGRVVDHELPTLSTLIQEGNQRLFERNENAIMILGKTGAGKTTLAHVLCDIPLTAFLDARLGNILLDAKEPNPNLKIGHRGSETKIPNKILLHDTTLVDCPGFNDTNPVQEIANSFYIQKAVRNTTQIKFILAVNKTELDNRGNDFILTLQSFMSTINNMEELAGSISLVVTKVAPNKESLHITNALTTILETNEQFTKPMIELIKGIMQNNSLYICHKPKNAGESGCFSGNLLKEIEKNTKYTEIAPGSVNITLSRKGVEMAEELLYTTYNNVNKLTHLIHQALINPAQFIQADNILSQHYERLVAPLLPIQSALNYDYRQTQSHLPQLKQLKMLLDLFVPDKKVNIDEGIDILSQTLLIMSQFVGGDQETIDKLQDYSYVLLQQCDYIKFLTKVSINNGRDIDPRVENSALEKMQELIGDCHHMLGLNMKHQVKTLALEANEKAGYYTEAIEYLKQYQDSPICKKNIANAYMHLAGLEEQSYSTTSHDTLINYYRQALHYNDKLTTAYRKLGNLFQKQEDYERAIECYKKVKDNLRVNNCFKAWTKKDETNPKVWEEWGDYCRSVGQFQKASDKYSNAFGLSDDEAYKTDLRTKALDMVLKSPLTSARTLQKLVDECIFNSSFNLGTNDEFSTKVFGNSSDEGEGAEGQ